MPLSWIQSNSSLDLPSSAYRINEAFQTFDIDFDGENELVFAPGGGITDPRNTDDPGFTVIGLDPTGDIELFSIDLPSGYVSGWVNNMLVGDFGAGSDSIIFIDHGREAGDWPWENSNLWRMDAVDGIWSVTEFGQDIGRQFWHSSNSPIDVNGDGVLDFAVSALSDAGAVLFLSSGGEHRSISLKTGLPDQNIGSAALIQLADGQFAALTASYSTQFWDDKSRYINISYLNEDGSAVEKVTTTLSSEIENFGLIDEYYGFSDIIVIDANQDGLEDFFVIAESNGGSRENRNQLPILLFEQQPDSSFVPSNPIYPNDFALKPTTGTAFEPTTWDKLNTEPALIDVTGDDIPDLVFPGNSISTDWLNLEGFTIGLQLGADTTELLKFGTNILIRSDFNPWNFKLHPTELNGDGIADFVVLEHHFDAQVTSENPNGERWAASVLKSDITASDSVQDLAVDQTNSLSLIIGSHQSDTFTNLVGLHTRIEMFSGNDQYISSSATGSLIAGGDGLDRVVYGTDSSQFSLEKLDDWILTDGNGQIDTLRNIERIHFSDNGIATDMDGHAGQTAKLLGAVFGASSVANKEYSGIGLSLLDGGMSYEALAGLAISVTGASTHTVICELLWENVVGVPAESADITPFVQMLDNGDLSVAQLVVLAADTTLNAQNIDLVGLSTTGLEYAPVG